MYKQRHITLYHTNYYTPLYTTSPNITTSNLIEQRRNGKRTTLPSQIIHQRYLHPRAVYRLTTFKEYIGTSVSNTVSRRSKGIKYKKNEIFLDMVMLLQSLPLRISKCPPMHDNDSYFKLKNICTIDNLEQCMKNVKLFVDQIFGVSNLRDIVYAGDGIGSGYSCCIVLLYQRG